MADPIKRVNYFDHQFLHVDDFIDEQKYHIGMRQHHNRLLHTWGIASGLDLSFKTGESSATVSEGVAVDGNGREIVLAESRLTPDLSGYKNKTVYITIVYSEEKTNLTSETGVSGNTRVTETPQIHVAEDPPVDPSQELILGRLMLDKNAKIEGKDEGEEPNKRRPAGAIGGDLEARHLRLSLPDAASSQWPALSCGAPDRVDLAGHLTVSGNLGIGTQEPKSPLSVSGGAAIGTNYAKTNAAPANGLIVQGNVGIGTTRPGAKLEVAGDIKAGAIQVNGARDSHLDADGAFYRYKDGQVYITVDDNLYIRDIDDSIKMHLDNNGRACFKGYVAARQAAFSAYLARNDLPGERDPLPLQTTSQNIGDHYSTIDSQFTAPVDGIYLFTMTGMRADENDDVLSWCLMVNGVHANSGGTNSDEPTERCMLTWSHRGTSSSRTIILALSQGDKVHVKQVGSGRCDNYRSGLEGVLLYATM